MAKVFEFKSVYKLAINELENNNIDKEFLLLLISRLDSDTDSNTEMYQKQLYSLLCKKGYIDYAIEIFKSNTDFDIKNKLEVYYSRDTALVDVIDNAIIEYDNFDKFETNLKHMIKIHSNCYGTIRSIICILKIYEYMQYHIDNLILHTKYTKLVEIYKDKMYKFMINYRISDIMIYFYIKFQEKLDMLIGVC